jgi:hypothetical protein
MTTLTTIATTDTFELWRTRTNQLITLSNSYTDGISNANVVTANTLTIRSFSQVAGVNVVPTIQSSFAKANTADLDAVAAFAKANTADLDAAAAFAKANTADLDAVAAFAKANIADLDAVASFAKANIADIDAISAFGMANTANIRAVAAYAKANTADLDAVAAFAKANNALPLSGGTLTGQLVTDATGIVTVSGASGSVAENTYTTLYSPGAATGIWFVTAWRGDVGDHVSSAMFFAINGGSTGFICAAQYHTDGSASDITFNSGATSIQAKRNSGAGTGTINYQITKIS